MKSTLGRSRLLAFALAGAGMLGSCALNTAPGELQVRWSIASTYDPNACAANNAPTIHVDVFYLTGGFAGEYAAACSSFATTIFLDPGRYSAQAFLVDPAGSPRTTAAAIAPFIIYSGSVFVATVDFPQNSFF